MTEPEDMTDENIWGFLGDLGEWAMTETIEVPIILAIIVLGERVLREGIAAWGSYKAGKHGAK